MSDPEIVLNLWYVNDETGAIYSLRANLYVAVGTEKEKLEFLRSRAELDYLIATPFPVPERFHVTVIESDRGERKLPVTFVSALDTIGVGALFEDAFKKLEARLPTQTQLSISESPLICVTPLRADADGQVRPQFRGHELLPPIASERSRDSLLSSFLREAGERPYRDLVAHHLKKQTSAQLQTAAMGEIMRLPEPLREAAIAYIDAVNSALGCDHEFWRGADCETAIKRILEVAVIALPVDVETADELLTPGNHDLAFGIFQTTTLSFAYSASTQRAQRQFMGIRKGLFG